MSFWGELKRRNVYKVGVAYAIVAWLIIQAVSITFPVLHLPGWAVTLVTVLVIIGFPFALLFAWAFEVTPEGIKRTKEVPLAESITHLTGQKLNYIVTGLLVLAVAFILFDNYYLERRAVKPEMVSVETEHVSAISEAVKTQKTIAVLPFENLSSDPEQVYFVDGLSEEILNSLAQIPGLNVIGRTSSFSFKGSNKTVQEIASVLGADNILEGSVRKAGNALRITAQLLRATDGIHLWSKTYDRELKDIFEVQQDIATSVANELKIKLGLGKSLKQLGGTDNMDAYELYLIAKGQMWNMTDIDVMSRALESIDKAIRLDPEFALAWAYKSYFHSVLSAFVPSNRTAYELDEAQSAAVRAIELEPNLSDAYFSLVNIRAMRGDFVEMEWACLKALELTKEPMSGISNTVGIHYLGIGSFKTANQFFKEALQIDPLNKDIRMHHFLNLGFLGDMKRAEDEYQRGRQYFGNQWGIGDYGIALLRLAPGDSFNLDAILTIFNYSIEVKDHLVSQEECIEELGRIYATADNLSSSALIAISMLAAYCGEYELSMNALEKGVEINAAGLWHIWLPIMKEVRQLPRFKEFVKKIGLVDYWNKFGWPDICYQLDNGDFVCD